MLKWLWGAKDGGPESKVWAWGLEIKPLFSVLLLKFGQGSREAYHNHAFHALSWLLSGRLVEYVLGGRPSPDWKWNEVAEINAYDPSIVPIFTGRNTFHKVRGVFDTNWVLTFRGPWSKTWDEYSRGDGVTTLAHGRRVAT